MLIIWRCYLAIIETLDWCMRETFVPIPQSACHETSLHLAVAYYWIWVSIVEEWQIQRSSCHCDPSMWSGDPLLGFLNFGVSWSLRSVEMYENFNVPAVASITKYCWVHSVGHKKMCALFYFCQKKRINLGSIALHSLEFVVPGDLQNPKPWRN